MGIDKGIAHRPGAFKQSNKEHKHGRHRSKGALTALNKGIFRLCFPKIYIFFN